MELTNGTTKIAIAHVFFVDLLECLAKTAIKIFNLAKTAKLTLHLSVSLNFIIIVNFATLTVCSRQKSVLPGEVKGFCLWALKNKRKMNKKIN